MTEATIATIGHNSADVGEILESDPATIYREAGMVDLLVDSIKAEIEGLSVNLETTSGRDAIKSLAHSISKRKVKLENTGKALTEEHRKAVNEVNAVKKRIVDEMDSLRDLARKPVTEWEQEEERKKQRVTHLRTLYYDALLPQTDLSDISSLRRTIEESDIDPDMFGDLAPVAEAERSAAIEALDASTAKLKQEAEDRAELERLRAEKAEIERLAAESARKEAEAKVEAERIASAEKAAAERAANEERQKAQAALDEERKKAEAAQAELDRRERERKAEAEALAKREADQKHRSSIMRAAKEASMEHGDVDEEAAKKIVLAIVSDSVPNVSVRF
jgi:colicin import membrane protein